MQRRPQELIGFFKSNAGTVRFSAILKAGFHPDSLHILEKEKKIEKIARGLYGLANYDFGEHPDLVLASLQAPGGVISRL